MNADARPRSYLGAARAENVYTSLNDCLHLPGDVAECGVGAGVTSRKFARLLTELRSDKVVHLFDSFSGLPDLFTSADTTGATGREQWVGNYSHSLREVVRALGEYRDRCELHPGLFAETLPRFDRPLCFIHCDADLYESTLDVIALAKRTLVAGGVVVFDDYRNPDFPGVRLAVDECVSQREYEITYSLSGWQAFARKRG
jgi:O-methyltransferase